MKSDTQHLEFLISQYVDGTLDPAARKSLEQQLLTDETARKLYQEQHETQDVLDDWGSRLPMINWGEFDAKLAQRLEEETPAKLPAWRKWIKPAAIAASLAVAVGTGYLVRSMQGGQDSVVVVHNPTTGVKPEKTVSFERPEDFRMAGRVKVDYSANLPEKTSRPGRVEVHNDPIDVITAVQSEGSDIRFRPGNTALSRPETQPGAVQAGGRMIEDESVFR